MIGKNEWLYLPQEVLSSDPLVYNVNVEVFTLTGPAVMQDNEIAAFFRDAQVKYGSKNILGILAESSRHLVTKREVSTTPVNDESTKVSDEKFIYEAINCKILIENCIFM